MKTNINQFIFSRTQPTKKLEVIGSLTQAEVLATTEDTIKRIVKETGRKHGKSRDKTLYISSDRQASNNWNAWVENIELVKGKLYLTFYVQYENTDASAADDFDDFIQGSSYRGELHRDDRYGNPRTYYFCFAQDDKARVMRSILQEYVWRKYADKLKEAV